MSSKTESEQILRLLRERRLQHQQQRQASASSETTTTTTATTSSTKDQNEQISNVSVDHQSAITNETPTTTTTILDNEGDVQMMTEDASVVDDASPTTTQTIVQNNDDDDHECVIVLDGETPTTPTTTTTNKDETTKHGAKESSSNSTPSLQMLRNLVKKSVNENLRSPINHNQNKTSPVRSSTSSSDDDSRSKMATAETTATQEPVESNEEAVGGGSTGGSEGSNSGVIAEDDEDEFTQMLNRRKEKQMDTADARKLKKNKRAQKKKANNQAKKIAKLKQKNLPLLTEHYHDVSNGFYDQPFGENQDYVDMDLGSPIDQPNILLVNGESPGNANQNSAFPSASIPIYSNVPVSTPPMNFVPPAMEHYHHSGAYDVSHLGSVAPVYSSTNLQGFGRMPPKVTLPPYEAKQHRPNYSFEPNVPSQPPYSILPSPSIPSRRTSYSPVSHTNRRMHDHYPNSVNRNVIVRFDSSSEEDESTDEKEVQSRANNQDYSTIVVGEKRTRVFDDEVQVPPTPPRKKARKEKLNQFIPVDADEVQTLKEEVEQKEEEMNSIAAELKQKEEMLSSVTESMYAHEQKRIALEVKKKALYAQLKDVSEQIDACTKECDTMKIKINLHENLVQRKKDQFKKVSAECKQMKLELYEVELHNSMVVDTRRTSRAISDDDSPSHSTFTVRKNTSQASSSHKTTDSFSSTSISTGKGYHVDSESPSPTPKKRAVNDSHSTKSKSGEDKLLELEKRREFLQNQKRLDQLQAESALLKRHEAALLKKLHGESPEDFIPLNSSAEQTKEPIESPSEVREEEGEEDLENKIDSANIGRVFHSKSIIFFMQECGDRYLCTKAENILTEQSDSFFSAIEDQIQIAPAEQSKMTSEATNESKKSKSNEQLVPFTSYESPLNAFRTYRSTSLFPLISARNKPTASAAPPSVDYDRFLCRNDLDGRRCNDPNCTYQHMADFEHQEQSKSTFNRITDALKRSSNAQKKNSKTPGAKYAPGSKKRELRVLDDFLFDRNARTIISNQSKTESRYYDKINSVEYENHLQQYPKDISYWIKYSMKKIIEFETNLSEGVKKALSILSRGLEKNPHSCDLWLVYCELYISRLNLSYERQGLMDIFASTEEKIHLSIFMWFRYIMAVEDFDAKLEVIEKAIDVYKKDVELDNTQRSRFITSLLFEKLRLLCQANRCEEAINAVKATYEAPLLTIRDDGDFGEMVGDVSSCLISTHKCNLWLVAIAICIKNMFPYEDHFVGIDFLSLVDHPIGINFNAQEISETKRKDVSRLFDLALNMFSKFGDKIGTNRDSLPLQLNRQAFLVLGSNSDFCLADRQFNDLVSHLRESALSDRKLNEEIPELLCFHLDCICEKFEGESTLNKVGEFFDLIIGRVTINDPYMWFKAVLFFAKHSNFSRINSSIWNYLNSYVEKSLPKVSDNDEMLQNAIEVMKNILDLPTTIPKNKFTRTMHYNVYAWMVYISLEVLSFKSADIIRSIFEQALVIFFDHPKEKQFLLNEFVEFSRIAEGRNKYEEVIDLCLTQDTYCWDAMKQVQTTIKLTKEDPLLKALIFKVTVRDFSFHNNVLTRFFETQESKLKGDLFECSLNILQGDIQLAIMWAMHEFSEKNFSLSKVILYKLVLVKPHAVNIWHMLIQMSLLGISKKDEHQYGSSSNLYSEAEDFFSKMIHFNPHLPYKQLSDYLEK